MLKVRNVTKYYGSVKVLNGVNLELNREQVRAFLGPNGAGKTTTFNIIAGVEGSSGGSIYLDDRNLTSLPVHRRAILGITYLPQQTSLFRGLTVGDNIKVYLRGRGADGEGGEGELSESLERMDILELKDRNVANLSAGQKRKVEIARALALSPSYLMLDEPFSDLDPGSVSEIQEILVSLKENEGMGIILSDHRAREALAVADYSYLLKDGRIIAEGTPEEVVNSEEARESYFVGGDLINP